MLVSREWDSSNDGTISEEELRKPQPIPTPGSRTNQALWKKETAGGFSFSFFEPL